MIRSGLVSITFRQLTPQAIIDLVAQSGLDAVEWGGDAHVPHSDIAQAHLVHQMTEDAGLAIASYGSYYRVGHGEPVPFEDIVESIEFVRNDEPANFLKDAEMLKCLIRDA